MERSQQQETQKFSINNAISDNFNVEKLKTAFAQGAAVDNDFSEKPTLYCVVNEMINNELDRKVLDTNNLKNFFSVLLENGMRTPAYLSQSLEEWGYAGRERLVLELLGRVQTKTAFIYDEIDGIYDAISDNFNVEKLKTAFAQGAAVDNDFTEKPTLYRVVDEMRNNEIKGQVLDTNNLKNFFSVLLENGMSAPADLSKSLKEWDYAGREHLVLDLLGRFKTQTASIKPSKSEVQSLKESGRDNSSGGAGIV